MCTDLSERDTNVKYHQNLALVKENTLALECCLCYSIRNLTIAFSCDHYVCLPCFKNYAISSLNQRKFIFDPNIGYTLGCPAQCTNTLITNLHIFNLMDKIDYEKYKTFACEEFVLYNGGVLCPTLGCGCGLLIEGDGRKISCPFCKKVFCRRCKRRWPDENHCLCDEEDANSINNSNNLSRPISFLTQLFNFRRTYENDGKLNNIKKCPKCRTKIEKNGGCNAITCSRCGFVFCWICETEFRSDCIELHWF